MKERGAAGCLDKIIFKQFVLFLQILLTFEAIKPTS